MKKFLFVSALFVFCLVSGSFAQTGASRLKVEKTPSLDLAPLSKQKILLKVVKYVAPKYPSYATAVGAKGEVSVSVKINKDGRVVFSTAESGHALLRKSSVESAGQWLFTPDETIDEREVKITFIFRIGKKIKSNSRNHTCLK